METEWESVIAHELFHQWFGDYVTTESWSNSLSMNLLPITAKHFGLNINMEKTQVMNISFKNRQSYLSSPGNAKKDLVRF